MRTLKDFDAPGPTGIIVVSRVVAALLPDRSLTVAALLPEKHHSLTVAGPSGTR
jgi:hypothetical protein